MTAHVAHPFGPFVETGGDSLHPVLLAVPHSGRFYPAELMSRTQLPLSDMRRLEDPLVDLLVQDAAKSGAGIISGCYARAWIDLNRRETEVDARQIHPQPPAHIDHQSPRVSAGLGLIPQNAGSGGRIYRHPLPLDEVARRIRDVHRPYHARIATRLQARRDRHGIAVLCDMHSMPSLPGPQAADIVIGDRHGRAAAPWLVDLIVEWLAGRGYRVARNLPYAGGYGVERHGNPAASIHAVQIEFDRRLYADNTLMLTSGAETVRKTIADLVLQLGRHLEDMSGQRQAAE